MRMARHPSGLQQRCCLRCVWGLPGLVGLSRYPEATRTTEGGRQKMSPLRTAPYAAGLQTLEKVGTQVYHWRMGVRAHVGGAVE
jgi:hypothetical protein